MACLHQAVMSRNSTGFMGSGLMAGCCISSLHLVCWTSWMHTVASLVKTSVTVGSGNEDTCKCECASSFVELLGDGGGTSQLVSVKVYE